MLEKIGLEKDLKTELTNAVGVIDVINEDRMQKIESI